MEGSGRYLIEVLSWNLPAENEKNYENLLGQPTEIRTGLNRHQYIHLEPTSATKWKGKKF
jgi:hypothetical protein